MVSPEVVVVAAFPLITTGTDANVQVRGVTAEALKVRNNIHIVQGRFFHSRPRRIGNREKCRVDLRWPGDG